MDYQLARQIRGTSLTNLITGRISSGAGVGQAISGSIRDKLGARGTRWKEMFDPLNITKKLFFGSNLMTAVVGRAMGRSSRDISYFTGINMRNRKYKDPKRTSIGPGRVVSVKVGDSETDVLAKMFNLMLKTHQEESKRYELEKSFREEQEAEDKRRHEELIYAIINKKRKKEEDKKEEPKEKQKEDDGGLFGGLLGKMGLGLIGGLVKSVRFLLKGFSYLIGKIETLGQHVLSLIGEAALAIMEKVISVVGNLIKPMLSGLTNFIFARVGGAIVGGIAETFYNLANFLKGKLPLPVIVGTVARILGLPLAAISAHAGITAAMQMSEDVLSYAYTSEEPGGALEKIRQAQQERDQQTEDLTKVKKLRRGSPYYRAEKRKIDEQYALKRAEIQKEQNKYFDEKIAPKLIEMGYSVDPTSRRIGGAGNDLDIPAIFKPDGTELSTLDYTKLALNLSLSRYGEDTTNKIKKEFEELAKETIKNVSDDIRKTESYQKVQSAIENIGGEFKVGSEKLISIFDQVEEKLQKIQTMLSDKYKDMGTGANGTVINNNTTVSGQTDNTDATEVPARNQDTSLQDCLQSQAVPC